MLFSSYSAQSNWTYVILYIQYANNINSFINTVEMLVLYLILCCHVQLYALKCNEFLDIYFKHLSSN